MVPKKSASNLAGPRPISMADMAEIRAKLRADADLHDYRRAFALALRYLDLGIRNSWRRGRWLFRVDLANRAFLATLLEGELPEPHAEMVSEVARIAGFDALRVPSLKIWVAQLPSKVAA